MTNRIMAIATFVLLLLVPRAAPQSLDGAWFKVQVHGSGMVLDADGSVSPSHGKLVAYVHVDLLAVGVIDDATTFTYGYQVWTLGAQDEWIPSNSGIFVTPSCERAMSGDPAQGIVLQVAVPVVGDGIGLGSWLDVHFVAKLKVKLDKNGMLKKASFKSMGCLMPAGLIDGRTAIGGGKVTGKTVPVSKLPFAAPG
ncbi:MAG: hypothetical protein H6825_05870 [Planctomycetes bacterium]|nr:hypothetical protein [Planctomycetota bacterium]